MDNKIDIYSIEKGCELLKEASERLSQISTKLMFVKDYYSKENLMIQDATIEDSISNCNNVLQNTINCIEDYVEDVEVAVKQATMLEVGENSNE